MKFYFIQEHFFKFPITKANNKIMERLTYHFCFKAIYKISILNKKITILKLKPMFGT